MPKSREKNASLEEGSKPEGVSISEQEWWERYGHLEEEQRRVAMIEYLHGMAQEELARTGWA